MTRYAAQVGLRAGDVAGLPILPADEATSLILALALARMGVASAEPSLSAEHVRLSFRYGVSVAPGTVRFDASWLAETRNVGEPVAIADDPQALLRVFASSGTTGTPKHFPISHTLMNRRMHGYWLGLGATRAIRMIAVGLGSTWGFSMALRTLWQGGTIVLFGPDNPIETLHRHAVTSLVVSPFVLRSWLDAVPASDAALPSLASIEVGGSVLPQRLAEEAARRLCPHIVSYLGSSEAGGIAAAPLAAMAALPGAVGYVFPTVQVQAVDEKDKPLAIGTEGILRIRSDTLASGYLGDDGQAFRDGWFYPGDIGTLRADGMLCLSGRASEIINCGGVKLSPHVIEERLLALPSVAEAVAFGVPDASGLDEVWAAIVVAAPIAEDVLDAFCGSLPPHMAPATVLQLAELPRAANGKVRGDFLVDAALQMSGRYGAGA